MLKVKNLPESERYFKTALNIQNDYEPAYRGLGALKYSQKAYTESIHYLKKGVSIFPHDIGAHYLLGMSYFQLKDCHSAIPHLNLVSQAQPDHPEVHGVLGACYEAEGKPSQAYSEYGKQLQVAPHNNVGKYAAERINALNPQVK